MSSKRNRSSPTGDTPRQASKKPTTRLPNKQKTIPKLRPKKVLFSPQKPTTCAGERDTAQHVQPKRSTSRIPVRRPVRETRVPKPKPKDQELFSPETHPHLTATSRLQPTVEIDPDNSQSSGHNSDGSSCSIPQTGTVYGQLEDTCINQQMSVLHLKDSINYIVPSFSVVQFTLLPAVVTFGDESDQFNVFFNSNGNIPVKLPFSLVISKHCFVEVTEFSKSANVDGMKFADDKVLIVWEWHILHPHDDCDSSSEASSESISPANSDVEADSEATVRPTHTISFKVIGCTKETRYQQALQVASRQLDVGVHVPVHIEVEPGNPVDPNAIAFMCNVNGSIQRIGYVVKEAKSAVLQALNVNDIIAVKFKWVRYVTDWYRMGPGYFAAVNITKKGMWPVQVVRARSTR